MYRDQFTAWKPGTKVLTLNSNDASVIYRLSAGVPHLGKSYTEFITKLFESSVLANKAIAQAIKET